MRAVDKVFQCSDMRRLILNFIITKFTPSSRGDTLRCSKVMKYYKKQLDEFIIYHPKFQYNSIRDSCLLDGNTDNYILEFIKFSEKFQEFEKKIREKYPDVSILVQDIDLTRYSYSHDLKMIGYNMRVYLCICHRENSSISDIDEYVMCELCKLNVPWVSLISSNFDHRLSLVEDSRSADASCRVFVSFNNSN